jgi:hypothetical protein
MAGHSNGEMKLPDECRRMAVYFDAAILNVSRRLNRV